MFIAIFAILSGVNGLRNQDFPLQKRVEEMEMKFEKFEAKTLKKLQNMENFEAETMETFENKDNFEATTMEKFENMEKLRTSKPTSKF